LHRLAGAVGRVLEGVGRRVGGLLGGLRRVVDLVLDLVPGVAHRLAPYGVNLSDIRWPEEPIVINAHAVPFPESADGSRGTRSRGPRGRGGGQGPGMAGCNGRRRTLEYWNRSALMRSHLIRGRIGL